MESKQWVLLYDPQENKMFSKSVTFANWFYFYSEDSSKAVNILKHFVELGKRKATGVLEITQIGSDTPARATSPLIRQTVGPDLREDGVFKITVVESYKASVISAIKRVDGDALLFEHNIPRSVRFVTWNNLRFLEKVNFSVGGRMRKVKGGFFEIPIMLYTAKDGERFARIYQVNERYEMKYDPEFEKLFYRGFTRIPLTQTNKIIICWNKLECKYLKHDRIYPDSLVLCFKDFCRRFLRIKDTLRVDKMKIAPRDYHLLNTPSYLGNDRGKLEKRFETLCRVFSSYFQQALFVTKHVCLPMFFLFRHSNQKIVSDFIFLSNNKNPRLICTPPTQQKSYKSGALIGLLDKGGRIYFGGDADVSIFSLDYSTMYPRIMLELFEKDMAPNQRVKLKPYTKAIRSLIKLKVEETNEQKKTVYKILLLAMYGSFAVRKLEGQYLLCANTEIAESIAHGARNLLHRTINFFSVQEHFNVVYCNTDSLVVCVPRANGDGPKRVLDVLGEWNSKNVPHLLKVERMGKRLLLLNKQLRVWLLSDSRLCVIGQFFNSVMVCETVRKLLNKILKTVLERSSTLKEFKESFGVLSKRVLMASRNYTVGDLFELVETRKDEWEGLQFYLPLYNMFKPGGSAVDGKFDAATNLVDVEHGNFRIDRRLEIYVRKVEQFLNKI
jgi:DNA polymerase elongation subunit (family B)